MFGCCGPIFLLSWPFFLTRSKWTLFPSGRFFHLWTFFSVDLFSVDLFSEHPFLASTYGCGTIKQNLSKSAFSEGVGH